MSSGYSSLEEDSEEYFFTARTSFFRKPLGKVSESKVSRLFVGARQVAEDSSISVKVFPFLNLNPLGVDSNFATGSVPVWPRIV